MTKAAKKTARKAKPKTIRQTLTKDIDGRFGRRIYDLRRARHLTQTAMAEQFGIDRGFLGEIEKGLKSPTLGFIEVLAVGLQVTLSELFTRL